MSDFNHFHSMKTSESYIRVLFYCPICRTPQYANRDKDLPKFCSVCHKLTSWRRYNE